MIERGSVAWGMAMLFASDRHPLACAAALAVVMLASRPVLARDARVEAEVTHLATCAAYFYNATNAYPMAEYERLFQAGERARHRALRYRDAAAVDRLMSEAATAMTAMTGGDWRAFERVRARYGARCAALLAPDPAGHGTER